MRSDQYSFLRAGIPATATGVGIWGTTERERAEADAFRKTHYHRAADHWEPDRDYGPTALLARFQFLLGLSVAQGPATAVPPGELLPATARQLTEPIPPRRSRTVLVSRPPCDSRPTFALGVTLARQLDPTPHASDLGGAGSLGRGCDGCRRLHPARGHRRPHSVPRVRFARGGRFPETPCYDAAARYVASELQALGLKPAGENGNLLPEGADGGGEALEAGKPRVHRGLGATDLPRHRGRPGPGQDRTRDGRVRERRGGLRRRRASVPEYGYDDFAQVDVRNKIVVVLAGAPLCIARILPLARLGGAWAERAGRARSMRRGARAAICVWTPAREALTPFRHFAKYFGFESMRLEDSPPLLPAAVISGVTFEALLKKAGRSETMASLVEASAQGKPRGFALGLTARLRRRPRSPGSARRTSSVSSPATPNCPPARRWSLRRAPGPRGCGEAGERGQHLHKCGALGPLTCGSGQPDSDCAGAFTTFKQPPCRGELLFLFVTAEERGLLGSEWFARHPTVPLKDIVADIDVGMGSVPHRSVKDVVALGTDESSLGRDVARAAGELGLQVSPDPEPGEADFVRSDNFNFVKKGIPAAQTFSGLVGLTPEQVAAEKEFWRKRYHQPQDEYEPDRDWSRSRR